ncbi:hypothetical protein V9L05_08290 [Bernardetia sp. Wsw4-3y2]|uniref:hypothetical protein n=1 Tax=Bernardetia sp. Wsw4-3y2 TaxID=3127471 RepID=UPI0030CD1E08
MKKYSISEKIIKKSFYLSVWIIEKICDTEKLKSKIAELEKLEQGTLGKEIAKNLKENNLNLVPNFESHDLKHSLLDFKMTPLDEIRMQAFMIGNGNWSLVSILIFLYGVILLPNKWNIFLQDFRKGQQAIPIKEWSIDEFADKQINELRQSLFNPKTKKVYSMKKWRVREISQYGSFAIIAAGIFGMLFCLPYLWSANIADLVGAGFPFVAGAILVVGGLINLSILSQKIELENSIPKK